MEDERAGDQPEAPVAVDRHRAGEAEENGQGSLDEDVGGGVPEHLAEERVPPELPVVLRADEARGRPCPAPALE